MELPTKHYSIVKHIKNIFKMDKIGNICNKNKYFSGETCLIAYTYAYMHAYAHTIIYMHARKYYT